MVTTEIPAAELAPGMVAVHRIGEGVAFEQVSEIDTKPSPFIHPPFDAELRERMVKLKAALDEVYNPTLEQWEDEFRRDLNMAREIVLWERMAAAYSECVAALGLTGPQRKECIQTILARVNNGEHALETVKLEALTKEQAKEILRVFDLANPKNETSGPPQKLFGVKHRFGGDEPWDYSTIENLEEFKECVADATIIAFVDINDPANGAVVYGRKLLESIASGGEAQPVRFAVFAIDLRSDQLEHLCAAVAETKGSYDDPNG